MATEQADRRASAFPGTSDFPVDWAEPDDAELTWEHDSMHMPFALAPLSIDYVQMIMDGIDYGYDYWDAPWRLPVRFFNGYAYMAVRYLVPEPHKPATDAYFDSGSPRQTAALEAVPPDRVGMAAGTYYTGRYLGGVVGASIAGAILGSAVTGNGVMAVSAVLTAAAVEVTIASLGLPSRARRGLPATTPT